MKIYDYLYTGTGPLSVIDGVIKSQKKKNVLFIDNNPQVGGAWVAIPVGKYGQLEIGCHIWSYNKKGYDFMKSFLDLNLIDLKPQPYLLKGDLKISYDRKNLIGTLKKSVQHLARLKLNDLYKFYRENPSARLPVFSKIYQYPKGGARDIQAAVEQKLKGSNAETALNERIERLDKVGDLWEVTTEKGNKFKTRQIKLTSTSSIKEICKEKEVITIKNEMINYVHFHLVIDQKALKSFSYIRLLDHPLIHRISDITYQLETNKNGNAVILVGVFGDKLAQYKSNEEITNVIMDYLKSKTFFDEEASLVYGQKNEFKTIYIDPIQLNKIGQLDDQLDVIHSTDLIYGVYYREDDWSAFVS